MPEVTNPGFTPASAGMYCELMENDEERNRRPDVGRRAFLDVLRPCRPRSRHVVAFVLGVLCLVLLIALIAVAVRLTSGPEVMKPTQPPFVSCPPEWYRFHSSCYILSDDPRDWLSSKSYCESRGAHLAFIFTAEEQRFLWELLPDAGWRPYWFGLSDNRTEGRWEWTDGTPLGTDFWMTGEPNNGEDENCGSIVKPRGSNTNSSQSWYNNPCSSRWPSICERELDVTEASTAPPRTEPAVSNCRSP